STAWLPEPYAFPPTIRSEGSFLCAGVLKLSCQQVPVTRRLQALPDIHEIGVRPDQDAGLAVFHAAKNLCRRCIRIGARHLCEARQAFLAQASARALAQLCTLCDRGTNKPRVNASHADTGAQKLVMQGFGVSAHRELAGTIRTLPRGTEKPQQAGSVHDVRALFLFEQRQEIGHAINDAPEVDVHQPVKFPQRNLLEMAEERHARIVE